MAHFLMQSVQSFSATKWMQQAGSVLLTVRGQWVQFDPCLPTTGTKGDACEPHPLLGQSIWCHIDSSYRRRVPAAIQYLCLRCIKPHRDSVAIDGGIDCDRRGVSKWRCRACSYPRCNADKGYILTQWSRRGVFHGCTVCSHPLTTG